MKKIFDRKKGMTSIALSEIIILILGTIAIAYALGSEMRIVSGAVDCSTREKVEANPSVCIVKTQGSETDKVVSDPEVSNFYWEHGNRPVSSQKKRDELERDYEPRVYYYKYKQDGWYVQSYDKMGGSPVPPVISETKTQFQSTATKNWKNGYALFQRWDGKWEKIYITRGGGEGAIEPKVEEKTTCEKTKSTTHSCQDTTTGWGNQMKAQGKCITGKCENSILISRGIKNPSAWMCCEKEVDKCTKENPCFNDAADSCEKAANPTDANPYFKKFNPTTHECGDIPYKLKNGDECCKKGFISEKEGQPPPVLVNPLKAPFYGAWEAFKGVAEEAPAKAEIPAEKPVPSAEKERRKILELIGNRKLGIARDLGVAIAIRKLAKLATSLEFDDKLGRWYDPEAMATAAAVAAAIFSHYVFSDVKIADLQGLFQGKGMGALFEIAKLKKKTEIDWKKAIFRPLIAAAITYALFYKQKDELTVNFDCVPWQAALRGGGGQGSNLDNCKKCNEQVLPCSEYQCKSLGQGCQLLNDEQSGEALCAWINRQDTQYPIIGSDETALLSENYSYIPVQPKAIQPPDKGVLVSYGKKTKTIGTQQIGCIPTFTPLRFGVNVSEPAICKIDSVRKNNFDEMGFFMSNGIFKEKHSYTLSLPSLEALEAEGIEVKSGDMELYIRCQDANGNANPGTFVFKFCVDEGPDETPPEIITTDLLKGMPVASGTQSLEINVYVNEPLNVTNGGCKWSHNDMNYENMENNMTSCITSASLMNSQGLYSCKANLSGIKDGLDNNFYFRCKDTAGNINKESYEFVITGTQPLVIDSAKPNATTIKEATSPVKVTLEVKTSAGYNDGAATCFYSDTGDENDYSMFLNTGTYQHSHELWLAEGNHIYYIKCVDLGGNSDYETISFDVETDTDEPIVTRVYHEDTYLKLITDEEAECVYDVVSCSYPIETGIKMTDLDETTHYTDWATDRNFYIKCQDVFGNKPDPDECSIIIRPQIYF